jgi:NADH-quinone oxidoreductase subunit E
MTVRRLADEAVQPGTFAFSPENQRWAEAVMARYPDGRQQSAVIPILWRAQEQEGWVTRAAIEAVAELLGMAYILVLEIATFYTQFLLKPAGSAAHVMVCGTTPCMLRGAEALIEVCRHRIHDDPLEVSADGKLSWEEVECLGACVNAPMIMIGNDTYEDLSVERFKEIVEAFAAGKGDTIKPGTQIARQFSAAEGGATTLTEEPTAERTRIDLPPPPPPAPPAPAAAPPASAAPKEAPRPAAATAPKQSPEGSGDQAPTKPGRVRGEVPEEAAPALKEPDAAPKASEGKAEAERKDFGTDHKANGEPNRAMREDATGAESPAGKDDGGKAPGKATRPPAPGGGASAGTAPMPPAAPAGSQTPEPGSQIKPTREKGGSGGGDG